MYRKRTVEAIIREHQRERQVWERERAVLIDRVMHLAGRPWTPAPVEVAEGPRLPDPYEDYIPPDLVGALEN